MTANQIQRYWQMWQQDNETEAKSIREQFVNKSIFAGFKKAQAWLVAVISSKIGAERRDIYRAINELDYTL